MVVKLVHQKNLKKDNSYRFMSLYDVQPQLRAHEMTFKQYVHTPSRVAQMDFEDVKLAFDLGENDIIFGFSPESLRVLCRSSSNANDFIVAKLNERITSSSNNDFEELERPGYLCKMSDNNFTTKLLRVAKACRRKCYSPSDSSETGYLLYYEARAQGGSAARSLTVPARKNDSYCDDGSAKAGKIYLPVEFYSGQLHVPILISCCGALTINTTTRGRWSEEAPLLISNISGVTSGTTTIQYVGDGLFVSDIETLMAIIREGHKFPLDTDLHLSMSRLLKILRREDGGAAFAAIREQIFRLQECKINLCTTYAPLIEAISAAMPDDPAVEETRLNNIPLSITVNLLGNFADDAKEATTGRLSIKLQGTVRALFGNGLSYWFDEEKYYRLKNSTARRLFFLYFRHINPLPFRLDDLREILGSKAKLNKGLLRTINNAHEEMFAAGLLLSVPRYGVNGARPGVKSFAVAPLLVR